MKSIMASNARPNDTPIAYLLECEADISTLAKEQAPRADLECYTPEIILAGCLQEYGTRPTGSDFPVIAVVETNSEYSHMAFTYIHRDMFPSVETNHAT